MKFTCRVSGGVATPQQRCVSCGEPVGSSTATLKKTAGTHKQTMELTFPVCDTCDGARQRVGDVDSKRAVRGCLISLPMGVLAYFAVAFLAARDSLAWVGTVDVLHIPFSVWGGMLLGWVIVYVAVYLAFGKKLSKDTIDPRDQAVSDRVEAAVKITGYQPSHSWTDGEFTIEIENVAYAYEFKMANFAGITKEW
jgi:hypothetical protein